MSEPKAVARELQEVVPGVCRWWVEDERIGGAESDAHAVDGPDGVVLVDPLPLADAALERLGRVSTICLTAACHQRAAWRYAAAFDVPVHAPHGTRQMEEEPTARYGAGDQLPGGLIALHAPGPEDVHFAFLRPGEPAVLFCPDLLSNMPGRGLRFVPFEYHDDPDLTRRSVASFLDLPFDVLCMDHGAPIADDPKGRIRELLASTP
jgi:hypothetical protein